MSGSCESDSPFLHVMPVKPDESFSDFQDRLLLTLSEENPFRLPLPGPLSVGEDTRDEATSELQMCIIGSSCIALLTKQGRAGRIIFEATEESPSPDRTELEWTAQDEALADQLRPQLEINIPVNRSNGPLIIPQQFMLPHLTDHNFGLHPGINVRFGAPLSLPPLRPLLHTVVPAQTEMNIPDKKQNSSQLDLKDLLRFSEAEWTPGDQLFSAVAVMTSEILLVSGGQLYSWPLEEPRPSLHPRSAGLQLEGEEIVYLSAASLRASVATQSGRVATFYDRSVTRHTDGISGVNLIGTLSHALLSVGLPEGDSVASLSVSETASYLLSQAGRVFWWGLVTAGNNLKSSSPHSAESVGVDAFVSLRESCPCPPGGLLLNLARPYSPLLASLSPEAGPPAGADSIQVKLLTGSGELVRWKRSETIFLENRPAVLGRVVAIDKELAVIDTSQVVVVKGY